MTVEAPGPRFVLLDGWQHRRLPGHWQGWLAQQLVDVGSVVDYPTLPHPDTPTFSEWVPAIVGSVGTDRPVVVAHGLSSIAVAAMLVEGWPDGAEPPLRLAMVAPPAPSGAAGDIGRDPRAGCARLGSGGALGRAASDAGVEEMVLIGSDADPYLPGGIAALAEDLGLEPIVLAGAGHLRVEDGFGPWPAILAWCLDGLRPSTSVESSELAPLLERSFRPSGRRLGIVVPGGRSGLPEPSTEVAADALRRSGSDPHRRLATLHPRHGEDDVRVEDLAGFLDRYGHEYAVLLLPESPKWLGTEMVAIEESARRAGTTILRVVHAT